MSAVRLQNKCPWEAFDDPSLERLEARLDWALCNLI